MTFWQFAASLTNGLTFGWLCKPEPKPPITALSIAVEELQQTNIELLEQSKLAEYHNGMVVVLKSRLMRLRDDINRLSSEKTSHV